MSTSYITISVLALLLALNGVCARAQGERESFGGSQRRDACRQVLNEGLRPRDPAQFPLRSRNDGGLFEYATPQDFNELDCAGVALLRETIQPNSLSRPRFTNTPHLAYITRGTGLFGLVIPGCPPTFRDPLSQQDDPRSRGDRRAQQDSPDTCQKIRRVRRGDVIAIFAGSTFWWYNDASNEQLRIAAIADVSNGQNQLDRDYFTFLLTGQAPIRSTGRSRGEEEETREGGEAGDVAQGIFEAFSPHYLARTLHVSNATIRRIQQQQQQQRGKGLHVRLQERRGEGLDIPHPRRGRGEAEREDRGRDGVQEPKGNGVAEETVCSVRMRHYLDNPDDAEIYVSDGGRINTVNRLKMASLRLLKLAADRVILRPRALFAPSWVTNAHRVIYVTSGRGLIQIVGDNGRQLFSGEVTEGQFIVIPQQFPAVKEANSNENFEWVAFLTNDLPVRERLAGITSVIDGLPREVLAATFGVDEGQAEEFKREAYRRREYGPILPAESGSALA